MEKTVSKMSFPEEGSKGYVFAGFKTTVPAQKALEFLKEQGDFLSLNKLCIVRPECARKTELLTINKEVVIKLHYEYSPRYWLLAAAKNDAEQLVEQIGNLLDYAELAVGSKGGK